MYYKSGNELSDYCKFNTKILEVELHYEYDPLQ